MDLHAIYAEPCPHCGATVEPDVIEYAPGGYDCLYVCAQCDSDDAWIIAFWANPRYWTDTEDL